MKQNIFAAKGRAKELLKDERYLYPEFIPERLPHRDREIEELAFALRPVLKGRKPENVFVSGKTGTGKTVTVKYVLKELAEYSDRAKSIFVNCFEFSSRHAILSRIANSVGAVVPRRGTGSDEVIERMLALIKKSDFTPIIVLDEADQLLHEGEASKLFYDLVRAIEREKARFGLVFISNDSGLTARLDERVRSSLAEHSLVFEQYSAAQLEDILSERAEYAFFPNVLEKNAVGLIAAHAARIGGDARVAIDCLLKAARAAEKENSEKVAAEHAKKAIAGIQPAQGQKALPFLSEQEKKILVLLSENQASSGELYNKFKRNSQQAITLRRFREIINALEAKHLVKTSLVSLKGRGRTRIITKT